MVRIFKTNLTSHDTRTPIGPQNDKKVYEVVPATKNQRRFLQVLADETSIDIWNDAHKPASLKVTVPGHIQKDFERVLTEQNLYFKLIIQDIQSLVKEHNKSISSLVEGQISFQKYHRYSEIQEYLKYLSINYPKIVEFDHYGLSYEKRNLSYIRISTGGSHHKPIIFIDAGIHAREWIAPAQALYILHQLVENVENRYLINNVDWIIIPLANPDGYEYSHVKDRFWRKTRSCGDNYHGVDPNRNFDIVWNTAGSSDFERSEIYAGKQPFSESETLALSNILLNNSNHIKLYLSFHSAAQSILYPFGFTNQEPSNIEQLHNLAVQVQQTIVRINGTNYDVSNIGTRLKPMSGTSCDWAYLVAGIDLVYMIELPKGGQRAFDFPANQILEVTKDMFEGIRVFHNYIEKEYA
ncbi:hypothetical protein RN001_009873 [Aquatica leii]|uniref:Peptidase M14 domain-containing protein n=1 Tax=Aquatica leii TaxID=1421715 RepID=A0AAN7SE43_9COLE|nr:hypothetical protein RN001_009873 [Aquatica leii]